MEMFGAPDPEAGRYTKIRADTTDTGRYQSLAKLGTPAP